MSVLQIEGLLDFLEAQPELALGRLTRTKEGRSLTKRLWQECAAILNNVSGDCVQKTADQWRIFYNEYKHKLLKKIKITKQEQTATGGGPSKAPSLTPLQERLYNILGRDVGEPLPGVRHNPLSQRKEGGTSSNSVNVVMPDDDQSPSNNPRYEIVEEYWFCEDQPELSENQIVRDEHNSGSLAARGPAEQRHQINLAGDTNDPSDCVAREPSSSQAATERVEQNTVSLSPPRRRRHRRHQQINEPEDLEASMTRATTNLEAMEQLNAQATREHAQATNRLAAALEDISNRLREPIKIVIEKSIGQSSPHTAHRRKRIRIIYDSSDSD